MAIRPSGQPVLYRSKSRLVYENLKGAIMRGSFFPGERLRLEHLAGELGVSILPVREALQQLEHEGLVQTVPHVGASVSDISVDDLMECYMLRGALEGLAARLAASRHTEDHLKRLRECMARMESFENSRRVDNERFIELNRSFHRVISEAAASPHLSSLIENVWAKSERYMFTMKFVPDRIRKNNREHRGIYAALSSGDPRRAETLSKRHTRRASADLKRFIERLTKERERAGVPSWSAS